MPFDFTRPLGFLDGLFGPKLAIHELSKKNIDLLNPRTAEIVIETTNAIARVLEDLLSEDSPEYRMLTSVLMMPDNRPESSTWQIFMSVIGRTTPSDWYCSKNTRAAHRRTAQPAINIMRARLYAVVWAMCNELTNADDHPWWRMPVTLAGGQYLAVMQSITIPAFAAEAHPMPWQIMSNESNIVCQRSLMWMRYSLCALIVSKIDDSTMAHRLLPVTPGLLPPEYSDNFAIISRPPSNGEYAGGHSLTFSTNEFAGTWLMMNKSPLDVIKTVAYLHGEVWPHDQARTEDEADRELEGNGRAARGIRGNIRGLFGR